MNQHSEKAVALFNTGYNCAQSTSCAYCETTQIKLSDMARLSSSFGGGFGRLGEVCGAFSGICIACGLLYGYADPTDKAAKEAHYHRIQILAERFKAEKGSLLCRELCETNRLRPAQRQTNGIPVKECEHLVRAAVHILDEYIAEQSGQLR